MGEIETFLVYGWKIFANDLKNFALQNRLGTCEGDDYKIDSKTGKVTLSSGFQCLCYETCWDQEKLDLLGNIYIESGKCEDETDAFASERGDIYFVGLPIATYSTLNEINNISMKYTKKGKAIVKLIRCSLPLERLLKDEVKTNEQVVIELDDDGEVKQTSFNKKLKSMDDLEDEEDEEFDYEDPIFYTTYRILPMNNEEDEPS